MTKATRDRVLFMMEAYQTCQPYAAIRAFCQTPPATWNQAPVAPPTQADMDQMVADGLLQRVEAGDDGTGKPVVEYAAPDWNG